MPTTLINAASCPPIPTPGAYPASTIGIGTAFSVGPTAPVSQGIIEGEKAFLRAKLNANAAVVDNLGRYGGGAWGIAKGLVLTAGTGLTVSVSAGLAVIDGPVESAGILTDAVPNNAGPVWVWLLRPAPGGQPTLWANVTLGLPASPGILLGSVTTLSGAVTAVDNSGAVTLVGKQAVRHTADTGAPTDTPPADASFLALTPGGVFCWTGAAYAYLPPPTQIQTTVTLPAHAVTLTAGENARIGVDFSGLGTFGSTLYKVECQSSDTTIIVSENKGPKTTGKAFFTLYEPAAGLGTAFNLTVTLSGTGWAASVTPTGPSWDSPAAIG